MLKTEWTEQELLTKLREQMVFVSRNLEETERFLLKSGTELMPAFATQQALISMAAALKDLGTAFYCYDEAAKKRQMPCSDAIADMAAAMGKC